VKTTPVLERAFLKKAPADREPFSFVPLIARQGRDRTNWPNHRKLPT
jgi:hypothetical protein